MTRVLLPPIQVAYQTRTAHGGRTYSATPGSVVSVPDQDAQILTANGWLEVRGVMGAYATTARPTNNPDGTRIIAGAVILDTTLNAFALWDGATWRNPATGASV